MKSKRTGKPIFFIVFGLILLLAFTAFFGIENYYGDKRITYTKGAKDIRWGIDIKGGIEAVFSPDKDDVKITKSDMDAAKSIIELRLNGQNVTDYEVFADYKNHQVVVRYPWASDEENFDAASVTESVKKLGQSGTLTFREGESIDGEIILTGTDVKETWPSTSEDGNQAVYLEFKKSGKTKFEKATSRLVGSTISIWMDDEKVSTATVNTVINANSNPYIDLGAGATDEYATQLSATINAGSLPFSLTIDGVTEVKKTEDGKETTTTEQAKAGNEGKLQIISPTLGFDALRVMIIAGSIAFGLICLIMILRYRANGVVASIALLGQLAGSIACISGYFPGTDSFTLTIPGIAGIILSIGVGVDCNVIAAERIRDEFAKGKTIDGAIDSGYKNSLSAIIDGNVTIVIVSLVLMGSFGSPESFLAKLLSPIMSLFGTQVTGSIYSFGYTLLVGTIFNLIMGVYASKLMIKSISQFKSLRKPWLYGGNKNA